MWDSDREGWSGVQSLLVVKWFIETRNKIDFLITLKLRFSADWPGFIKSEAQDIQNLGGEMFTASMRLILRRLALMEPNVRRFSK